MGSLLLNPQAQTLNECIKKQSPTIFHLLSEKGKAIYFPKEGILAQSAEAKGSRINATIGIALDEDRSPLRLSSIADRIKLPPEDIFPYAPSFGKPELRSAWKQDICKKNPSLKDSLSNPIVTSALTHALSMVGYLFVENGDEILSPDMFWGNYRLVFEKGYGATLKLFNTFRNGGFDVWSLETALYANKKKKLILLLNFPNNPTGYTPTTDEAKQITAVIHNAAKQGKEILTIIDDAYFGLVYKKGILEKSLFSFLSSLHPNILAVKIDGATKEQYVWGLRVGFITYASKGANQEVYSALESKTAGAIRGNISNASHLSQSLILSALSSPSYAKDKERAYLLLKKRFDTVEKMLENKKYAKYFTPLPYNSGYFMCVKLSQGFTGEVVRKTLLKDYSTGVISIGDILRIAFSSVPTQDIPTVFENIYKVCKENSKFK